MEPAVQVGLYTFVAAAGDSANPIRHRIPCYGTRWHPLADGLLHFQALVEAFDGLCWVNVRPEEVTLFPEPEVPT